MSLVNPGWFSLAIHGLVLLACSDKEVCPSSTLAERINAHAVYLRRVMALLVRAHIVEAREGRHGGYRLARAADQVSLGEVYRALQEGGPLAPSAAEIELDCPIGAGVRSALSGIIDDTEAAVLAILDQHTLAEVAGRAAGTLATA
ncbi:MAG: Rrf2 family transcriptional regulator, repressor of oqxAB [Chloroflexota bacterium]|jgi:Rrf2 family protein|nr:Rrf2 family transcriptional regulator, repressor of oqxAB [Chloroflexota bacterium]